MTTDTRFDRGSLGGSELTVYRFGCLLGLLRGEPQTAWAGDEADEAEPGCRSFLADGCRPAFLVEHA